MLGGRGVWGSAQGLLRVCGLRFAVLGLEFGVRVSGGLGAALGSEGQSELTRDTAHCRVTPGT